MIVVTGAAGFIGSCLVGLLNSVGKNDVVVVDDFSKKEKEKNLVGKRYTQQIDRESFETWFNTNQKEIDFVFHFDYWYYWLDSWFINF